MLILDNKSIRLVLNIENVVLSLSNVWPILNFGFFIPWGISATIKHSYKTIDVDCKFQQFLVAAPNETLCEKYRNKGVSFLVWLVMAKVEVFIYYLPWYL